MSPAIHVSSKHFDTVIIGNGPSALILSYILHGHIPRYKGQHPDENIHRAISTGQNVLVLDPSIYEHLRSSLKFSSQAHPINVLLDTLLRPYGDVSDFSKNCIKWSYEPKKALSHVVLGESPNAGGQWADNPIITSKEIDTLSYAEQLSLPGYTFEDHWLETRGEKLSQLVRPSRADVAEYYAQYPQIVGIADSIHCSERVYDISRHDDGFYIASHAIQCKNLVLASGTFSINLPPPRSVRSLAHAHDRTAPMLVIGSGFTAADIIMSAPPNREILHVYNWDPQNRPSPLKGCHSQAYPEYAWIYRQMKLAAAIKSGAMKARDVGAKFNKAPGSSTISSFSQRDWGRTYTGFPNARAAAIEEFQDLNHKEISIRRMVKVSITSPFLRVPIVRDVGTLHYAAGRRGSLAYLSSDLLDEVLDSNSRGQFRQETSPLITKTRLLSSLPSRYRDPDPWTGETYTRPASPSSMAHSRQSSALSSLSSGTHTSSMSSIPPSTISGNAFRDRIDETESVEVAPNVFAIGSLTGDSLVRFAPGGCCAAAGAIMKASGVLEDHHASTQASITNGDVHINGKENKSISDEKLTSTSKLGRAAAAEHHPLSNGVGDFHSQEYRA